LFYHLGHVTAVYNQSGDKVESHHYSLYGTASGDAFSQQPFGFSTKRNDFASGLVYFGYRFYVPHLGRWLNRDPLQEAGGINLYAYVNGDPLGYVDPDGRFIFVGIWGWSALSALADVTVAAGFSRAIQICIDNGSCQLSKRDKKKRNKSKESKPKNCPAGTKPIDEYPGLSKDDIHGIKDGVDAGPRDWTGITPDGDVITGNHQGNPINHGPKEIYLP
jgi:RHS repeat-associated protein